MARLRRSRSGSDRGGCERDGADRGFGRARRARPQPAARRRGLGVVGRDTDMLARSLALWEEMGAVPYAARVRCERALLTGDHAELGKGLAVLEGLGDRLQVSRYERRQVG